MKKFLFAVALMTLTYPTLLNAQEQTERPTTLADYKVKPYDDTINAMVQIDEAVAKANAEGKRVICQVGGNWCIWCLRFADFITKDEQIHQLIDDNFVYIHVNYSPKNKNEKAMKRLGNQKLGFPYFVLLDQRGKVKDVKESGDLEENKSYNREKVLDFFTAWKNLE